MAITFRGTYEHVMDDRGRVAIPARYRDAFRDGAVLVQSPEGCVEIYTVEGYENVSQFVVSEPAHRERGRRLRRGFFARSWDGELDRQGRILIPAPLRQAADLAGPVIISGRRECLEVWQPARWQQEMERISASYHEELENLP